MPPTVHLSLPTWIIHVSSVLEYGVAIALLFRQARERDRQDVRLFATCMLVHFVGALFILAYHATDDTWQRAIDFGRTFNGLGSVSLLLGIALMWLEKPRARAIAWGAYALVFASVLGALFVAMSRSPEAVELFTKRVMIVGNTAYLAFVVLLVLVWRKDREAFSGLAVVGFFFMFAFVGVTVWAIREAVTVRGLPTLAHADALHGAAEGFLTITNLLIVAGVQLQRRRLRGVAVAPRAAAAA